MGTKELEKKSSGGGLVAGVATAWLLGARN